MNGGSIVFGITSNHPSLVSATAKNAKGVPFLLPTRSHEAKCGMAINTGFLGATKLSLDERSTNCFSEFESKSLIEISLEYSIGRARGRPPTYFQLMR